MWKNETIFALQLNGIPALCSERPKSIFKWLVPLILMIRKSYLVVWQSWLRYLRSQPSIPNTFNTINTHANPQSQLQSCRTWGTYRTPSNSVYVFLPLRGWRLNIHSVARIPVENSLLEDEYPRLRNLSISLSNNQKLSRGLHLANPKQRS